MDIVDQSFNLSIDGGSEAECSQTALGTSSNAEVQVYLTPEDWDSDFPHILGWCLSVLQGSLAQGSRFGVTEMDACLGTTRAPVNSSEAVK